MTSSETLYAVAFIGVFPALWILATVFDHIMPDNSGRHSPRETLDEVDHLIASHFCRFVLQQRARRNGMQKSPLGTGLSLRYGDDPNER